MKKFDRVVIVRCWEDMINCCHTFDVIFCVVLLTFPHPFPKRRHTSCKELQAVNLHERGCVTLFENCREMFSCAAGVFMPQGRSQTFQNEGAAGGRQGGSGGSWGSGWPGLKIAALHRILYKVSFHLGQGCNRKIFLRGQSHFSWFFSRREMFSRWKISILVHPKQILAVFKSEKQNKNKNKKTKKKSPLSSFLETIIAVFKVKKKKERKKEKKNFLSSFWIFPLPLFPGRSAEISLSEVCGGPVTPLI